MERVLLVRSQNDCEFKPYDPRKYTISDPDKIEEIIVPNNPSRKVFNQFMRILCFKAYKLKKIIWNGVFDLSNYGITKLEDMMFSGCGTPKHMDLSGFRTHSIEELHSIFDCCDSLKSLDLSNWDLSNVKQKEFYIDSINNGFVPEFELLTKYVTKRDEVEKDESLDEFPDVFTFRVIGLNQMRLSKIVVKNCNQETKDYIKLLLQYISFGKEYISRICISTSQRVKFVIKSPFIWEYSEENEEFNLVGVDENALNEIKEASSGYLKFGAY